MKYIGLWMVLFSVVFSGFAAEDSFEGEGTILSVQEMSGTDRKDRETLILKVHTSQRGAKFAGTMLLSLEIKDKNKRICFGEIKASARAYALNARGAAPSGRVEWVFTVDASGLKHPKFTGYSVKFLCEEGGQSVLLDSEFEDCDSAEELAGRNKKSEKIKIVKKVLVDYSKSN